MKVEKKRLFVYFVFIVVLLRVPTSAQGQRAERSAEQSMFSAEDSGVRTPVAIPRAVLQALRKDRTVRNVLVNEGISPESLPEKWFAASVVHLRTRSENDLVIIGLPPVSGGNLALFWVFRPIRGEYQLVLSEAAHSLRIENTRSNGYRDIEITSFTASEQFHTWLHFNGERYEDYKTESRPNQ